MPSCPVRSIPHDPHAPQVADIQITGRPAGVCDGGLTPYHDMGLTLAEMERRAILAALASHHGNKAKTARALGISLRSIYNKIRRHGITVGKDIRDPHHDSEGQPLP